MHAINETLLARLAALETDVGVLWKRIEALEPSLEGWPPASKAPKILKSELVIGKRLRFRNADVSDAAFILSLRLNPAKNAHLSTVSPDLSGQERWLQAYASDTSQAYFIIETLDGMPVGTVRLYGAQGDSFSWGSWILNDDAPQSSAVESTLMVYAYGLALGFCASHFEVRKGNEKVWAYHERCGAVRTHEDDLHYYYSINKPQIEPLFERYRERLPDGIAIRP
jgi:RimJ/RimL family protein N-acetyltransferase